MCIMQAVHIPHHLSTVTKDEHPIKILSPPTINRRDGGLRGGSAQPICPRKLSIAAHRRTNNGKRRLANRMNLFYRSCQSRVLGFTRLHACLRFRMHHQQLPRFPAIKAKEQPPIKIRVINLFTLILECHNTSRHQQPPCRLEQCKRSLPITNPASYCWLQI